MFISRLKISFQKDDQFKLVIAAVALSSIHSDRAPKCRIRSTAPRIVAQARKRTRFQATRRCPSTRSGKSRKIHDGSIRILLLASNEGAMHVLSKESGAI